MPMIQNALRDVKSSSREVPSGRSSHLSSLLFLHKNLREHRSAWEEQCLTIGLSGNTFWGTASPSVKVGRPRCSLGDPVRLWLFHYRARPLLPHSFRQLPSGPLLPGCPLAKKVCTGHLCALARSTRPSFRSLLQYPFSPGLVQIPEDTLTQPLHCSGQRGHFTPVSI